MKKLLAIVLVLGLASFAGAALKVQMAGNTLQIVANGTEVDTYFALIGNVSGGAFAGNIDTTGYSSNKPLAASDLAGLFPEGTSGIGGMLSLGMSSGTFTAGPVLTGIQYVGKGPFSLYTVDPLDETGTLVFQNSVPEPITMTLMGLGGLVALRRRMA